MLFKMSTIEKGGGSWFRVLGRGPQKIFFWWGEAGLWETGEEEADFRGFFFFNLVLVKLNIPLLIYKPKIIKYFCMF